jgi:hypothetical protein
VDAVGKRAYHALIPTSARLFMHTTACPSAGHVVSASSQCAATMYGPAPGVPDASKAQYSTMMNGKAPWSPVPRTFPCNTVLSHTWPQKPSMCDGWPKLVHGMLQAARCMQIAIHIPVLYAVRNTGSRRSHLKAACCYHDRCQPHHVPRDNWHYCMYVYYVANNLADVHPL